MAQLDNMCLTISANTRVSVPGHLSCDGRLYHEWVICYIYVETRLQSLISFHFLVYIWRGCFNRIYSYNVLQSHYEYLDGTIRQYVPHNQCQHQGKCARAFILWWKTIQWVGDLLRLCRNQAAIINILSLLDYIWRRSFLPYVFLQCVARSLWVLRWHN